MITAIAIDDEKNALGIIQEYASQIPDLDLKQVFTNPLDGLSYLKMHPSTHLALLDIRMSKLNGIQLAQQLPEQTRVVFTTAYSDYAVKGYELDAVDYLMKPFSFERFERAIKKIRMLSTGGTNNPPEGQKKMLPSFDDILLVKTDYKIVKVHLQEVLYIEGAGNYLIIHTIKGKILTLATMKAMEEQLLPYQFIRTHKSFIISFQHVESIERNEIKINGKEIPVGESYKEAFQAFMNTHYKQI